MRRLYIGRKSSRKRTPTLERNYFLLEIVYGISCSILLQGLVGHHLLAPQPVDRYIRDQTSGAY